MAYGRQITAYGLWLMTFSLWLMAYGLWLIPYALCLNILHRIGNKKTSRIVAINSSFCSLVFGLPPSSRKDHLKRRDFSSLITHFSLGSGFKHTLAFNGAVKRCPQTSRLQTIYRKRRVYTQPCSALINMSMLSDFKEQEIINFLNRTCTVQLLPSQIKSKIFVLVTILKN